MRYPGKRQSRILLIVIALFMLAPNARAATAATQATPEPGTTPQFAIVPVGDHPSGFFEDIELAPGNSTELAVEIVNIGEIPVDLRLFKVNALNGANGGFVTGEEEDPPIPPTDWIELQAQEVHLEPQQRQQISFTVTVPEDANPGQYIAGLHAQTVESMTVSGSDVLRQTLGYAISVGILVPGEITESFELGDPSVQEGSVVVPIINTGNYLVRPTGELTLTTMDGEQVHTASIEMGSVYAGRETTLVSVFPEQIEPGNYLAGVTLTDEASSATAHIEDAPVEVPEPEDPTGLSVESLSIAPNADPIAFANIELVLHNGGNAIAATNVALDVMRDGEEVESFPLATNQVLPSGETELSARYLPADTWESGTYTFQIVVSAVDPEGGTETILATIDVEDEIVVP